MKKMKISIPVCVLFFVVSCFATGNFDAFNCYAKAPSIIKFATVAPEGSTWTNVLRDIDKELDEKSGGSLRLKIYAGGVQGDEKDVVRKMRIGQTHCAGFTGVGLGEVLPEVRILDLPFFIDNYDEVDYIREKFTGRFVENFEKKGYVFLGWTEVGFVYFYSAVNVKTVDEMKATKMWMWEGDPLAKALFDALDMSPIALTLTDVMTSLQTGLVNSVYVSPLGIIALQWFTKVGYMLDLPMADATGAILITKKKFNKLSPEHQVLLKETFKTHSDRLLKLIRRDNDDSLKLLKDAGVKIVPVTDEKSVAELKNASKNVRNALAGKLYPAELLNEMTAALEERRNGKAGK